MTETQDKSLEFDLFSENPFFKEGLTDCLKEVAWAIPQALLAFGVTYVAISCYFTKPLVDLTYYLTKSFQGGF